MNPQYSEEGKMPVLGGELSTTRNAQTQQSMDSDFQYLPKIQQNLLLLCDTQRAGLL